MSELFTQNLTSHIELVNKLYLLQDKVTKIQDIITESFRNGGKLMICGNGGSAADAQHIAAEFTGRFIKDRRPLPAMAMTTDTSALTCISNDYGYEYIFSRQVEALGREGDIMLGISTSGNSRNIKKAMMSASKLGMHSIGLLGGTGGDILNEADFSLVVPSDITARIQEAHIIIGHTICGAVEMNLGLANN